MHASFWVSGLCYLYVILLQGSCTVAQADAKWLSQLHPQQFVRLVFGSGEETTPQRCNKATTDSTCVLVKNGVKTGKKPVITPQGPVFLTVQRFTCKRHVGGTCMLTDKFSDCFPAMSYLSPIVFRAGTVTLLVSDVRLLGNYCCLLCCVHRRALSTRLASFWSWCYHG